MPKHWRTELDSDGIRWLSLDKTDSPTNVLSLQVLEELRGLLDRLESAPPAGVVIKSAKPTGFILGADLTEFERVETVEQAEALAREGQASLSRIEALPCPTVAVMNGYTLGGGLELALACDYRVAVEGYDRCIGFPEVQLGIHPGFGGTVRSVRLLGMPLAMDLMLTGRSISPMEAFSVGLVDQVADPAHLDRVARDLVLRGPPRRKASLRLRVLALKPLRLWLGRRMRARVMRRARCEHYPAPRAIVDLWIQHGATGSAAYRAEARSIAELMFTTTSKNLVRLFFLRERLRGLAVQPSGVKRVHVVGAGVMGGDIASWCVLQGLTVTLQDRTMKLVEPALERAAALFDRRLKAPGAADAAKERLTVDIEGEEIDEADVVIEAIVEQLDPKRALFRELESRMQNAVILGTNTSSIRLEQLAEGLEYPGRFLGLHFFNPVSRLPLVEVIRGDSTDEESLNEAIAFVARIGKLPLPCRSSPGFVVNRVLAPYMLEALLAHQEGHELETIDKAAECFGMPTGPVELADRVGLDVALDVTGILSETLDVPVPALLKSKVQAGELGAKTGHGFYRFENDRPLKAAEFTEPDALLEDRLILALVNEAMACYEDGVVEDLDLLDAGVVFGTGFAPFTGGPIQYARQRGIQAIIERLKSLADAFGPRFSPRPGWQKLISAP